MLLEEKNIWKLAWNYHLEINYIMYQNKDVFKRFPLI